MRQINDYSTDLGFKCPYTNQEFAQQIVATFPELNSRNGRLFARDVSVNSKGKLFAWIKLAAKADIEPWNETKEVFEFVRMAVAMREAA